MQINIIIIIIIVVIIIVVLYYYCCFKVVQEKDMSCVCVCVFSVVWQ